MSPILQNPLSNATYQVKSYFPKSNTRQKPTQTPKFPLFFPNNEYPLRRTLYLLQNHNYRIKSYDSSISHLQEHEISNKQFNFDNFLSLVESLCVISSMVVSVGCLVDWAFLKQQNLGFYARGNRILVFLLAGAVAVGSVIRRRQWRRVCGFSDSKAKVGSGNGNVLERIEMLEDSMKSSTTIVRVLSRQLEKLGLRFRLHRKSLKEPISEAAALAQKNSVATRALALQEDILEKELGEVQKVLLAMQEQQHKQLELILAIAKSGKLIDTKQEGPTPKAASNEKDSATKRLRQADGQQIQAISGKQVANDVLLG